MTELKGQLLGTYHQLRSQKLIHIAVWVVLLVISLIIISFTITESSGLFGGAGLGVFMNVIAVLVILITTVFIITNVLAMLLTQDIYLEIYEDGFKVRRTGIGLMMWRNRTDSFSWNELSSYRIDTKSFHNTLGYAGSPDPLTGLIVKLVIGIFTTVTEDKEYALTISFTMADGKKMGFREYRGDNFRQLTDEILPGLLKHKRRIR